MNRALGANERVVWLSSEAGGLNFSLMLRVSGDINEHMVRKVALDFMGIENYVVSGMDIEKSGHFWVYVKEYDLVINNAHVSKQKGFVHGEGRFKLINYIGHEIEGLSFFWENNEFEVHGNLNPEIVIELLQYAQKEYGFDIGGVNHVNGQRQMVSLQELIETLKAH